MSVDFTMTIKSGNDAFADNAGAEVARILRAMAEAIDEHGAEGMFDLRDINGNYVGNAVFEVWAEGED
jgi:hypothetical protein